MASRNPFDEFSKQYQSYYNGVQASSSLPKPKAPSKTELAAAQEKEAQFAIRSEAQAVRDQLSLQDWWVHGSIQQREAALDNYEKNIWPEYARQRFGEDQLAANSLLQSIMQPLRYELKAQRAQAYNLSNKVRNLGQSIAKDFERTKDVVHYGLPMVVSSERNASVTGKLETAERDLHIIEQSRGLYSNDVDWENARAVAAQRVADLSVRQADTQAAMQEDASQLAAAITREEQSEKARREANPYRENAARREAEIKRIDPDAIAPWRRILEDKSLLPLANLVAENAASTGISVLGSLAAGTAGAAVAGPAGGLAAGSGAASALNALQVGGGLAHQVAQEVFTATPEQMKTLPAYQKLTADGKTDEEARAIIARDAIVAIAPQAFGLGAMSGFVGPEALIARTSVLSPLIKGGILKRVTSGAALSALEEGVEEGTEQVLQNLGWNVGTGDTRALSTDVRENAILGAMVGGVLGGVGGIRTERPNTQASAPGTPTPTAQPTSAAPVTGSAVPQATSAPATTEGTRLAGMNVPGQTDSVPVSSSTANPVYNPSTSIQATEITEAIKTVSNEVSKLHGSTGKITTSSFDVVLPRLYNTIRLGASVQQLTPILDTLQTIANRNTEGTINVRQLLADHIKAQTPQVATPVTPTPPVTETPTAPETPTTAEPTVATTPEPVAPEATSAPEPDAAAPAAGETDASTGPETTDRTGDGSDSQAATPAGTDSATTPIVGVEPTSETGGTAEGGRTGGTAYPSTGTPEADVHTSEPVAGTEGRGTDSGPDGGGDGGAVPPAAPGVGGVAGQVEQRPSDGRFGAILSELAGLTNDADVLVALQQFRENQAALYRAEGYSEEAANQLAQADVEQVMAIHEFFQEKMQLGADKDFDADYQWVLKRLHNWMDTDSMRDGALLVTHMLRSIASLTGKSLRSLLDPHTLSLRTTNNSRTLGSYGVATYPSRNITHRIGQVIRLSKPFNVKTLIHEFTHYYMQELSSILAENSGGVVSIKSGEIKGNLTRDVFPTEILRQAYDDFASLCNFAGISKEDYFKQNYASKLSPWKVENNEKITTAIEYYLTKGAAPEYTGIAGALARIVEFFRQTIYMAVTIVEDWRKGGRVADIYSRLRTDHFENDIPADVTKAFDRMFQGYTGVAQILHDLDLTDISQTQRLYLNLERAFISTVNSYMQAGLDPDVAYRRAMAELREQVFLSSQTPTEQVRMAVESTLDESIDYVADVETVATEEPGNLSAVAVEEGTVDPSDMLSPLVTLGQTSTETTERNSMGRLRPDVELQAKGPQNGIMLDNFSMTTSPEATPPLSTDEGIEEVQRARDMTQAINALLSENEPDPTVATDPLDKVKADPQYAAAIRMLEQQAEAQRQSLERGAAETDALRQTFTGVAYSPEWVPGRWAKMATAIRRALVDGGAAFRTYCLRYWSSAKGSPDQTPLWQAFDNLPQRCQGAAKVFWDNVMTPLTQWAQEMAGQFGVDGETFLRDVGSYRTALHTIEAAYKLEQELLQAVQQAYMLPPGPDKVSAVAETERNLNEFRKFQVGEGKCAVYGGRSVTQAQQIILDVEVKYGKEIAEEGSRRIGNGLQWTTRFLMENGQLSETDAKSFDDWLHYTPMLTARELGTGGINDITYAAPRQNFHRYGSESPAMDAFSALVSYGSRAARSVGMTEFGNYLFQAYTVAKEGNRVSFKSEDGRTVFYNGMMFIRDDLVNGILNGERGATGSAQRWANNIKERTAVIIRVMERNDNGETVIRPYRVLFEDPQVAQAVRSPFYSTDPDNVVSKILKGAGRVTGTYSMVFTRAKAVFPVLTSVRDMIERVGYLPSKRFINTNGETVQGYRIAAQMIAWAANPMNLVRMARYHYTGTSGSLYMDGYIQEFFASGTNIANNYTHMLRRLRNRLNTDIDMNLPAELKGKGRKVLARVKDTLFSWQDVFYSMPSFAQYIKMRENNINVRDTVYGVTTLMNMQERGAISNPVLAPFFPFVNSIGQTATNMLGALGLHTMTFGNHPNAKNLRRDSIRAWAIMMVFYAGVRALIPLIKESLGDDGEERMDLMPLGQLSSFIPVGIGDGEYFKWPVGFGFGFLASMMAYGADRVERGKMSPGDLGAALLTGFGKTLIPNSMPAFEFSKDPMAFILQTISPLLLQPVVQVASNRTYSGAQITYDTYDRTTRKSDGWNLTTHQTWRQAVKNIYDATGIDMSPEELRALTNGYLGGALQAVMSWIEADPLYSNPMYQSTREQLGPFWSAMGATSIYDVGMNIEQSAFYEAREYYNNLIQKAGIGRALKGTPEEKESILMQAGFRPDEIQDYFIILALDKELSKMSSETRGQLDKLMGPDMDEGTVRQVFREWSSARQTRLAEVIPALNYYKAEARRRFEAPSELGSALLRHEVEGSPVEVGNIDVYNRPATRNPDGTVSTVRAITIQDNDGLWVNIPTVGPNGQDWSMANGSEAIHQYFLTGQHLGKYRTRASAEQATQRSESMQGAYYRN